MAAGGHFVSPIHQYHKVVGGTFCAAAASFSASTATATAAAAAAATVSAAIFAEAAVAASKAVCEARVASILEAASAANCCTAAASAAALVWIQNMVRTEFMGSMTTRHGVPGMARTDNLGLGEHEVPEMG